MLKKWRILAIVVIGIFSIGTFSSFAQTQETISVATDKKSYNEGDTIVISGQVSSIILDTPVTIQIFNQGNLVDIVQVKVAQDGKFSYTVLTHGPLWQKDGTYIVRASYGVSSIVETSFEYFLKQPGPEFESEPIPEPMGDSGYFLILRLPVSDGEQFSTYADVNEANNFQRLKEFVLDSDKPLDLLRMISNEMRDGDKIASENLHRVQRWNTNGIETLEYGVHWTKLRGYVDIGRIANQIIDMTNGGMSLSTAFSQFDHLLERVDYDNSQPASEPKPEPKSGINVLTDKSSYDKGEIIKVSGEVTNPRSGVEVGLTVISPAPSNNIVAVDQVNVDSFGKFEYQLGTTGDSWAIDGTYTIKVTYGNQAIYDRVTINLGVSDKPPPIPSPSPEQNLFDFIDPKKGTQYILDRYYNEPAYKKWFDTNYPGYTIEEAIAIAISGSGTIPSTTSPLTARVSVEPGSSVPGCEETSECYLPYEVRVAVGGEVTWANDDTAAHTVTSGTPADGPDGNFDSSLFMAGTAFSVKFDDSGTHPYFCMVHPWMLGVVVVGQGGTSPPPPTPRPDISISVDTDSSLYDLGDIVNLSVKLSGTSKSQNVGISVTDPTGHTVISRTLTTDSSGRANTEFGIHEDFKTGTYTTTATVSVGGVTYKDTSRFKIESQFNQIQILSVEGTDQQGNPSSFSRGELGFVKVVVSANKPIATLVTVNLFDSELTTIGIASFRTTLSSGESEMILSFLIPDDAALGAADIYSNAFSDWPSNGGIPLTSEFSAQVRIT